MTTHRLFSLIALGMTVAVSGSLLSSCKDQASAKQHGEMPAAPVQVTPIIHENVNVSEEWYGYLRGVEDAAVKPQVTGVLVEKSYKDGSLVEKGAPLFEIDKSLFQATLDQAKATLAQAKAAKAQALAAQGKNKQDVERYAKLVASGSVSEKNLTDAQQALKESEAQVLQAEAQIQMAEAQIETARINLEYATIKAPISGIAGVAAPSVGDLLSPANQNPLVTVSSINPIRVDFAVSDKTVLETLGKLKKGERNLDLIPKFQLILPDGKTYGENGHVVALDRAVDMGTGQISVVGQVPNPDFVLRPGMSVRVRAVTETIEHAALVPERAIVSVQSANFVIVLGKDNVPSMVPVKLGPVTDVKVKDENGKERMQPMQVITLLLPPDKMLPAGTQVVVQGSTAAMQAAGMHKPVRPEPFVYSPPQPTIESKSSKVSETADGAAKDAAMHAPAAGEKSAPSK